MNIESSFAFTTGGYLAVAAFAFAFIVVAIIIDQILCHLATRAFSFHRDGEKSGSILTVLIKVIVYAFFLGTILKVCLGIDVTVIWGALGIGGVALSLGLQNTISNLLGGMALSLSKDISVGEWISVGSSSGRVQDIKWSYSEVLDDKGSVHIIPNSVMNSSAVTVMPKYMRVDIPVTLRHGVDIDSADRLIAETATASLDKAGMRYEQMDSIIAPLKVTEMGTQVNLVVFSTWDYTEPQVRAVVLPQVINVMDREGLTASFRFEPMPE